MKFGVSFLLFATISMMFAVAYAEEPAAAVVVTTEAPVEVPVTGGIGGGAEVTKNTVAGGEVTGKAQGGVAVEVSTIAPAVVSSDASHTSPSIETTTKGIANIQSQLFTAVVFLLCATLV